jgi:hypothetical protein
MSKTAPFNAQDEIAALKLRVAELEHTLRIAAVFISASVKHFTTQHPEVALKWLMDTAEKDRNRDQDRSPVFNGALGTFKSSGTRES